MAKHEIYEMAELYCGSVFTDRFNSEESQIVIQLPPKDSSVIKVAAFFEKGGIKMISPGERTLDIHSYIHSTNGTRLSLDEMITAITLGYETSEFGEEMKQEFIQKAVKRLENNYSATPICIPLQAAIIRLLS